MRQQAEIVLNNFDLTPAEVDAVVKEWNEEINSIPRLWYTAVRGDINAPMDLEENHALSVLTRIAIAHVRRRQLEN